MLRIFASTTVLLALLILPDLAQADHDINPNRLLNEIPMYGKDAAKKPDGQNPEASAHAAQRGFEFFFKGDTSTAIKRFNQAWMLDRNNATAYWGFAMIMDTRDHDFAGAVEMMNKATSLRPKDAALQKDFALLYGRNGKHEQALKKLLIAQKMDPNLRHVNRELSTAYFFLENASESLKHAKLSRDAGEKIDPKWIPLLTCMDNAIKGNATFIEAGKSCYKK